MNALTIANIETEIDALAPRIAALLPPDVSPDKFRTVALAAIRAKPDLLQKCDQQSLFNAILNAAQDGLMPDGREGAIVPRKSKAVWQPMILGIYKRVKSSGSVATLTANVVYDGETFDVLLGDDDRIVHRRDMTKVKRGAEVAVYAIAGLKDGTKEREVMTWEQVQDVRQTSAAPNSEPWTLWADEMARKTVVRRLAKRLPVLDAADEALQRTINRVDSLYDFGTPAQTIEHTAPDARDALNAALPMKQVPLTKPAKGNRFYREPPSQPPLEPKAAHPLDEHDGAKWMINFESLMVNAQSQDEVVEIAGHHSVGTATAKAPAAIRARISELLAAAYGRFPETADADASHEPASAA